MTTDDEVILTCPGLSVFVYEAGTQEEGENQEGAEVQTAATDDPLTSANVYYRAVNGTWEHQYTVGFLREGRGSRHVDLGAQERQG